MPANPTKGLKGYHLEMDEELMERVRALARTNGRPLREEVAHAIERHLAAPPVVRVEVEAVDLGTAEAAPAKRKRGRPKKDAGKGAG